MRGIGGSRKEGAERSYGKVGNFIKFPKRNLLIADFIFLYSGFQE